MMSWRGKRFCRRVAGDQVSCGQKERRQRVLLSAPRGPPHCFSISLLRPVLTVLPGGLSDQWSIAGTVLHRVSGAVGIASPYPVPHSGWKVGGRLRCVSWLALKQWKQAEGA